ncbi:MAG: TonB-dependent receptor [Bryobacteraceae bacterium]
MTKSSFVRSLGLIVAMGMPLLADSLTGKVVDPQGAVVANARLSLSDQNSGNMRNATSSASGEFSFADLSAGNYLLEAQTGSSLSASEKVMVSGSTNLELKLSVSRSTVRVFVSATSSPMSEQEITKTIDVVDAKEINERDEYSIGEVLRTIPGVQVQTQVGGLTSVKTRGLRSYDTAVLIDGLRFRDASGTQGDGASFLGNMTVTDLGRAEFLRGSGASLYGSNAIGGTLSLNSNDGGGKTHGSIRTEGGGLGFVRGTANLAGGLGNDRFVYSGGASHVNTTAGVRGVTPSRNSSGQFFGKYYFTPGLSLSGRVWGSNAFSRSVDGPAFSALTTANFPAAPAVIKAIPLADSQIRLYETRQPYTAGNATFIPGIPDPDGSNVAKMIASAFILRHELSAKTSWRASYQRVNARRTYHDGPAGLSGFEPITSQISNSNGDTDQLQLRFDTEFARFNRITAGYEFEHERMEGLAGRNLGATVAGRSVGLQNSHSFYGQDQMHFLNDRLQVVFGGRVQKFDLKNPSFTNVTSPYETTTIKSPENAYTGDVSIAYFIPKSNTKLRAHAGNGYRAPSLYERFGSGFSTFNGVSSFTYYGDPRLASEKSKSFDTGVDQWFFKNKARASATFFYTDLSNIILFDFSSLFPSATDPFKRFGGYRNALGGGISRGVELSTQFAPTSKTSVSLSYMYVNADQRTPTIGTNFFSVIRTAKNTFSMTATQWITTRLNATFDFYALGDSFESPFGAGSRRLQFAGPRKADIVVNYKLPISDSRSVDIYGKVENFTNRRYTDNGFLAPGAWAIGGVKFNF